MVGYDISRLISIPKCHKYIRILYFKFAFIKYVKKKHLLIFKEIRLQVLVLLNPFYVLTREALCSERINKRLDCGVTLTHINFTLAFHTYLLYRVKFYPNVYIQGKLEMIGTLKISGRKYNVQSYNFGSINGDMCSVLIILITKLSNCSLESVESKTCFWYKKVNFDFDFFSLKSYNIYQHYNIFMQPCKICNLL